MKQNFDYSKIELSNLKLDSNCGTLPTNYEIFGPLSPYVTYKIKIDYYIKGH